MSSVISNEVMNKVTEATGNNVDTRIPVIITLEASYGSNFSSLENEGFSVNRPFPAINAVAGTALASSVIKLAKQPGVRKIEYDGEVRAL